MKKITFAKETWKEPFDDALSHLFAHITQFISARASWRNVFLLQLAAFVCFFPAIVFQQKTVLASNGKPKYNDSRVMITIDPGHGGHDFGVEGPTGIKEKDVTLKLALELQKAIEKHYTVRLTRDGDYSLDADKRTALNNYNGSRVFISLHTGGGFAKAARGIAVYYHTNQLLLKQKAGPNQGALSLPWDEIQAAHKKESRMLAKLIQDQLMKSLDVPNRGVHEAPLIVFEGADSPAVLIEIGFLGNPAEEARLKNKAVLSQTAEVIAAGIDTYIKTTDSCIAEQGVIEEEIRDETGRGAAW